MKKTLITIVAVAVLAVVYFFFIKKPQEITPDTVSNTKINIDEVCQGALAYMTFSDAAAAEVFVGECKEGKHPEVIERYKVDMNLGDGAAI